MKRNSFTVIELVFGLTAGAVVGFVAAFLMAPADNWIFIMERRTGSAEVERAMDRMLREIGRIKSPSQVTTFAPSMLSFTDIDNQVVNFTGATVSGGDLMRDGDPLIKHVQSLLFEYLARDGTAAANAAAIRVIRVTIVMTAGRQTVQLQSATQLKNGTT